MSDEIQLVKHENGVATVTLNRPQRRNAMNSKLVHQLLHAIRDIHDDDQIRVLELAGAGDCFCAGMDLHWMQQGSEPQIALDDAQKLATCFHDLFHLNKPTVARVNGPAYGGGVGLVCCCDIAIGAQAASFTLSEVRLGLVAAVISPYLIASLGPRQTRRYLLTAETINSAGAQQLGILHQVVTEDELDEAMSHQLEMLLMGGPNAQGETKKLLSQSMPWLSELAKKTAQINAHVRFTREAREGVKAFLEKRKPDWSL